MERAHRNARRGKEGRKGCNAATADGTANGSGSSHERMRLTGSTHYLRAPPPCQQPVAQLSSRQGRAGLRVLAAQRATVWEADGRWGWR